MFFVVLPVSFGSPVEKARSLTPPRYEGLQSFKRPCAGLSIQLESPRGVLLLLKEIVALPCL